MPDQEDLLQTTITKVVTNLKAQVVSSEIKQLNAKELKTFFQTFVYHIKLQLETENGPEKLQLLAKKMVPRLEFAKKLNMDIMFCNEVLIYEHFFSQLSPRITEVSPKYYYGYANGLDPDNTVVLEYLEGYELSRHGYLLPKDHVEIVLRQLGIFHGLGYIFKETHPKTFNEICSKLLSCNVEDTGLNKIYQDTLERITACCAIRGFQYLPDKTKFSNELIDKFQNLYLKNKKEFRDELFRPKNELAIICHADFNQNNIMFKYNESGEVINSKIIDFQRCMYSQPAIDLSLLLALNTPYRDLEDNFEKYFAIYHNAVYETIKSSSEEINLAKYSYSNFLKDYATHGFLGYEIAAFFMPACDSPKGTGNVEAWMDECGKAENLSDYLIKTGYWREHIFKHVGAYLGHIIDLYQQYSNYNYLN